MEVHNLMEELVIDSVEEVFSDREYIEKAGCSNSDNCKTDVVCYVLNRVNPIYTTSSRGLAHIGKSYIDKPQSTADIAALVNEGIRQVGTHRRQDIAEEQPRIPDPPMFNFPIFKGRVYDGKTFAPFTGSSITLKMDGQLVKMHGARWSNPCPLIPETEGSFLFWPLPVKAESQGEIRKFSMCLELEAAGYKPVRHFINIDLAADDEFVNSTEVNRIFKVDSLYLFDINEPEEVTP